jgi:hypothetical protein
LQSSKGNYDQQVSSARCHAFPDINLLVEHAQPIQLQHARTTQGIHMTYDELMALPDISTRYEPVEKIVDGKRVQIPVLVGFAGVIWQEDDDPIVYLPDGTRWKVGWHKGQRVRQCMEPL